MYQSIELMVNVKPSPLTLFPARQEWEVNSSNRSEELEGLPCPRTQPTAQFRMRRVGYLATNRLDVFRSSNAREDDRTKEAVQTGERLWRNLSPRELSARNRCSSLSRRAAARQASSGHSPLSETQYWSRARISDVEQFKFQIPEIIISNFRNFQVLKVF